MTATALGTVALCAPSQDETRQQDAAYIFEPRTQKPAGVPLDRAEDALRSMYDAVRGDAVLARIFSIGQGYRKGGDEWEHE